MKRWTIVAVTVLVTLLVVLLELHRAVPSHQSGFVPGVVASDRITEVERRGDAEAIVSIAQGSRYNPYRLRRPVPIAVDWLFALGRRPWMPYAMIPLTLVGAGLMAWALYDWLGAFALVFVLLPGTLASINGLVPIGLGAALIGWRRRDWRWLALAALTHETFLLFALHRRKGRPFLIYGAWAIGTVLLYGFAMNRDTFGFLSAFSARPQYPLLAITSLAFGVIGLVWGERWMCALLLAMTLCLGQSAWARWTDYSRILLPLWVFGLLAIASWVQAAYSRIPRWRSTTIAASRSRVGAA